MKKGKNKRVPAAKKPTGKRVKENKEPLLVVGIGASAGGLEAFSQLLKAIPYDTGMAFIFIQHLEPKHESKLSEILSGVSSIPVKQVKHNMEVKPDNVYVIPPDKYLAIKDKKLLLSERKKNGGLHLPIDHFFQSLAKEKKNKAIGIILSGTASDGTEGLKAIKAKGGLTFAQDEESAKYTGMPASAVDSGNVDIVLPPEKIARELIRIARHPYIAFSPVPKEEETYLKKDDSLTRIFKILEAETGVDFSHYKTSTIKRRITRRMVINKINKIDKYVKLLNEDKNEVKELYYELLINVTNFFRDPEVFYTLKTKVYPEILKNKSTDKSFRVWVPGCATGEEAYSIAISLMEFLDKKKDINVQIFATDISEHSIEKARAGIYPESSIKDLSPELLKNYFIKADGGYQISKSIREVCVFARQDISKDPPFSKIDLVSCRNLLIYLSSELQKKIIPVFHYALNQNGFLLLGTSESIGTFADLFQLFDKKYKVYKKKSSKSHYHYKFSYHNHSNEITEVKKYKNISEHLDIQKETDKIVLNKYAPAGILINQNLDIIYFRGKINQYIEPAAGDASLNLFKMIKKDLNLELHTALRKAKKNSDTITIENIKIDKNGSKKIIDLEVIPVKASNDSPEIFFLIIFKDKSTAEESSNKKKRGNKKESITEEKEKRFGKLKEELLITKEHLQSIIEEREATNEELRSTLEELQSSNEELQSTNEEMETAREELQSTNEELMTVNDELESRNEALSEINNDLINLLKSINQPVLILGRDLRIKRFTSKAESIWNLIPGDVGRPISNLKPNIEIPDLKEKITEVMEDLNSKELEAKDNNDNWYSVKIRPYKTIESKIDGVVITLYDIDIFKRYTNAAIKNKEYFEAILNTLREALLILDKNLKVIIANKVFFKKFKVEEKQTINRYIYNLGQGEWNIPALKKLLEEIIPEDLVFENYEVVHNFPQIGKKKMILNARKIEGNEGRDELILLAIEEEKE